MIIIEVQATPFHNNIMEFPFDSDDIKNIDSPDPWSYYLWSGLCLKIIWVLDLISMYLDPEPDWPYD